MKQRLLVSLVIVTGFWHLPGASAELPPLIPREALFGNPDKANPEISPDGTRLAYLAPDQGVLNVWLCTLGQNDDRPITHDRNRGIQFFGLTHDDKHIIYIQDKDGDENWHLYAVNLASGEERDLTPFPGIQAHPMRLDPAFPDDMLVAINQRDRNQHDVYRLNIATGQLTLVLQNDEGYIGFVADHNYQIRAALRSRPDGGADLLVRDTVEQPWRQLYSWGPVDLMRAGVVGFTPDNQGLYLQSSVDANTLELKQIDIATGDVATLAGDPRADVFGIVIHPTKYTVQAVGFLKERMDWRVLDDDVKEDFAVISRLQRGSFNILDRDRADRTWLVAIESDIRPNQYYVYNRDSKTGSLLFSNKSALERVALSKMEPIRFQARDGLTLNAYLTTPRGVPAKNLPMVVLVHPGPWSRNAWGFDAEAQWLANRGYAVLQVNYRGSVGFGKDFGNAANRDWGGAMQQDLLDGVKWAVKRNIADPEKVAIMGSGFGGYAAMHGLASTPNAYACGVSANGIPDLVSFVERFIETRQTIESIIWDRIGHPERDAERLRERSPRSKVDKITKPLLIAHGANHPRVSASTVSDMVEALRSAGKTVEYVEYPNEGDSLTVPANRLDFYARVEKFFAEHLGGRYEEPPTPEPTPVAPADGA